MASDCSAIWATYGTQETGAGHGVQSQQQPGDGDHVVLDKRLAEDDNDELRRVSDVAQE